MLLVCRSDLNIMFLVEKNYFITSRFVTYKVLKLELYFPSRLSRHTISLFRSESLWLVQLLCHCLTPRKLKIKFRTIVLIRCFSYLIFYYNLY